MFEAPPAPPVLSPAEAKAAAAKAKADPKAVAAAAADAAAALAAIPPKPCALLSPDLAAQLNPVVITPCKVTAHTWCRSYADSRHVAESVTGSMQSEYKSVVHGCLGLGVCLSVHPTR